MKKQESLILAYIFDGKGGGKRVDWKGVETWEPAQGILWVHLNYTSKTSQHWLKQIFPHQPLIAKNLYEEESRPRSVICQNGILIFLRAVNSNPASDPEDMVTIRIWMGNNIIITTRKRKLLSLEDLHVAIENKIGPKTTSEFLIMLTNRIINHIAIVVDEIEDMIDQIEDEVILERSHLLRPKITEIRRKATIIRRYLSPQREALSLLYIEQTKFLSQDDRNHLREGNEQIIRFIEELDSIRDRAIIIQEELTSRLAEQMDKRMYILSVAAIIFLPLSFITGLLGINVGGIPGGNYHNAFYIVISILIILALIMLWVFHRKKWI